MNPAIASRSEVSRSPTGAAHVTSTAVVGVVIPVYNRRSTLIDTLPHVLAQSRLPDRLVIADDGSADGSADAAEAWLDAIDPPFEWRVLRLPHRTAAAARVSGHQALGATDYVAFLDSDDHWPPDFLERALSAFAQNDDAVAASVDRRYTDLTGQIEGADDCREMVAAPLAFFFRKGAGVASCTLIRTIAYETVGGWRPELGAAEDAALFSSLALQGRWVHVPGEPVDFYLGHAARRGEENNLSRRWADAQFRWVRVYDQIFSQVQQQDPQLPGRKLRRLLAGRWYNAGKDFLKIGRHRAAQSCFAKCLRIDPLQVRVWRRAFGVR